MSSLVLSTGRFCGKTCFGAFVPALGRLPSTLPKQWSASLVAPAGNWRSCASSSSSAPSSSSQPSDEKKAAPHKGHYVVEGVKLPMADEAAQGFLAGEADDAEARLATRLRLKKSSQALMGQREHDDTAAPVAEDKIESQLEAPRGMFAKQANDKVEDAHAAFRVGTGVGNTEHLNTFQDVYAKLRRTGRDGLNDPLMDRDVSDSLKYAMEYTRKKKASEGKK
eukprot:TRINITY_DN82349_c0_g1_i1.p1 TRINITY_DN82349_c0_g1~~TRINITY_DN82349_c0_g1_i1.p1  ORF type:complete len:223 (+),score=38.75 TRINITY_DN82349_c0_g1_i1:76-744(+)